MRLLKRRWYVLSDLRRWRLLRSIAAREHLHAIRYYERRGKGIAVVNCGPVLRQRRLAIARSFVSRGISVHPGLLKNGLPKGPSGYWLEDLCPWAGPNASVE